MITPTKRLQDFYDLCILYTIAFAIADTHWRTAGIACWQENDFLLSSGSETDAVIRFTNVGFVGVCYSVDCVRMNQWREVGDVHGKLWLATNLSTVPKPERFAVSEVINHDYFNGAFVTALFWFAHDALATTDVTWEETYRNGADIFASIFNANRRDPIQHILAKWCDAGVLPESICSQSEIVSLIEALWNMRLSRPLNEMIELTHEQTRILKRYAKRRLSDAAKVLASMQVSL
jgi:hypothetical protein